MYAIFIIFVCSISNLTEAVARKPREMIKIKGNARYCMPFFIHLDTHNRKVSKEDNVKFKFPTFFVNRKKVRNFNFRLP